MENGMTTQSKAPIAAANAGDVGATEFERSVKFSPAFDRRHTDPKKNYGVHCVDILFVLKGALGAVQFSMFSGWWLPKQADAFRFRDPIGGRHSFEPMGADLGYHSPRQMYEGQKPMTDKCHILGCQCFYDGSALNAEPVMARLIREGDKGVWEALEEFYREVFGPAQIATEHAARIEPSTGDHT